jgi:hypothetical protein
MARRNFCNARASPLTRQVIVIVVLISLSPQPLLGMNCHSGKFFRARAPHPQRDPQHPPASFPRERSGGGGVRLAAKQAKRRNEMSA